MLAKQTTIRIFKYELVSSEEIESIKCCEKRKIANERKYRWGKSNQEFVCISLARDQIRFFISFFVSNGFFLNLCVDCIGLDFRDEHYFASCHTLGVWRYAQVLWLRATVPNHQYWIKVIRNCLPSQHERNQSRRKVASLNKLKCFAMLAFFMAWFDFVAIVISCKPVRLCKHSRINRIDFNSVLTRNSWNIPFCIIIYYNILTKCTHASPNKSLRNVCTIRSDWIEMLHAMCLVNKCNLLDGLMCNFTRRKRWKIILNTCDFPWFPLFSLLMPFRAHCTSFLFKWKSTLVQKLCSLFTRNNFDVVSPSVNANTWVHGKITVQRCTLTFRQFRLSPKICVEK